MSKTSDFSSLARLRCAPVAVCVVLLFALSARAQTEPAATTSAEPAVSKPAVAVLPRIALRAALAEALSRELRVRLAQADVARARALLQSARAGYLPTLVGHASYTRLDKERRSGGGGRGVALRERG